MTPLQEPAAAGDAPAPDWRTALWALRGAYAERTLRDRDRHFSGFELWCQAHGRTVLPADAQAVADHVREIFRRCGRRHVESRLAVIRFVHAIMDMPDVTRALPVRVAYRHGLRAAARPTRRAAGLDAGLRDRLLAACGPDLLGCRDRALLWLGYDTLCRRAELAALRVEDIERYGDGTARVRVRRSKTDPYGLGDYAYLSAAGLAQVEAWLAQAQLAEGPILRPVFKTKPGRCGAHPRLINRRLRALADLAGVDPRVATRLTGHSFRVGTAQDLAAAGFSLIEIMRAGRWRGLDAVALYVRDAPIPTWSSGRGRRSE